MIRHSNDTQLAPVVSFKPLLKDEGPYYENINRGSKSAYDYADSINKVISYGGYVSVLTPKLSDASDYSLYQLVIINEDETISAVQATSLDTDRAGIILGIVTETVPVKYVVCLFCPNLIVPSSVIASLPAVNTLMYSTSTGSPASPLTSSIGSAGLLSNRPIAKVTGRYSIFFSGTSNIF